MAQGSRIYVAIEGFAGVLPSGREFRAVKGATRIAEDHPALKQWPDFFSEVEATVHSEDMTREPGRRRGQPV